MEYYLATILAIVDNTKTSNMRLLLIFIILFITIGSQGQNYFLIGQRTTYIDGEAKITHPMPVQVKVERRKIVFDVLEHQWFEIHTFKIKDSFRIGNFLTINLKEKGKRYKVVFGKDEVLFFIGVHTWHLKNAEGDGTIIHPHKTKPHD